MEADEFKVSRGHTCASWEVTVVDLRGRSPLWCSVWQEGSSEPIETTCASQHSGGLRAAVFINSVVEGPPDGSVGQAW